MSEPTGTPGAALTHAPDGGGAPAIPEVVTQFIAVTAKQNEIREKEVEIQKYNAETERQKASDAHAFALKALDAQVNDRKDERNTQAGATRFGFWISMVLVVGMLGVIAFALYSNKEQFIVEIIKLLAVGGGGGGIGFAVGVRKGEKTGGSQPST